MGLVQNWKRGVSDYALRNLAPKWVWMGQPPEDVRLKDRFALEMGNVHRK